MRECKLNSLQIVTCIPTHRLPKNLTLGAASVQEIEMIERQIDTEEELSDDAPRGQLLWIRGLTRLQHQVHGLQP